MYVIWIFTESEGDGIEYRLSSKIFFYFKEDFLKRQMKTKMGGFMGKQTCTN